MPNYSYIARSFSGEEKRGEVEVANEHELAKNLHSEGYILVSADIAGSKKKADLISSLTTFSQGVSLADKMMFARNLRIMVSAGISIPKALGTLSSQSRSKKFRLALHDIAERVTKGDGFAASLAAYPDIFSELFMSMIEIGEQSGTLEESLKNLTMQMEREYELKSKIKGALIYPAVVIAATIGIGILMLIVVVPQLAATFAELKIKLPLTTRIVVFLGVTLSANWYFLPFILFAAFFIFKAAIVTSAGQKSKDAILLKTPIIAGIVKQSNAAYISRALNSLLASGVPIVQGLEILSKTTGNDYFKKALTKSAEDLKRGGKLSEALMPYQNLFPSTVLQMMEVGEETGQMAEILGKVADFFEEELTNTTRNLSSLIEPVLMLFIGAIVGFFAVSMIQPLYTMTQGL